MGWKSELTNDDVNSSKQAIRILSGVAGLSSGNHSLRPISALAAMIASLMANNTADARKNGGSPTALDEWMALTFGWPYQLVHTTINRVSYHVDIFDFVNQEKNDIWISYMLFDT